METGTHTVVHGDLAARNFVYLSFDELTTVWTWRNSDFVRRWMLNSEEIPLESHLRFIERLRDSKCDLYWLVEDRLTAVQLGVIYLNRINWEERCGEFGVYKNPFLATVKGVGKRLSEFEISIAFRKLHLRELTLTVHANNVAAVRVYDQLGFILMREENGFLLMKLKNHEFV